MSRRAERVAWVIGLVAAVAYCALMVKAPQATLPRMLVKPVPIACLIAWVLASDRSAYGRTLAAGLACAAVGDVLLVPRGERWFLGGLVANLVAHVVYTVAFVRDVRRGALVRAVPFVAWVGGMFLLLRPGLGAMQVPVAAYSAAIAVMMWRAAARVGPPGDVGRAAALAGAAGAISFGVSDTLLALHRFHAPIEHVALPIIATYWLGQLGIAWSAGRRTSAV